MTYDAKSKKRDSSIDYLRTICQTPESSSNDSFYGKVFARKVSIYITKFLLYTPLTCNQATILWCITDLVAAFLFSFGDYWYTLAGALLAQLAYVLDGTDGEIARYRNTCSLKGEYLDRLCHNICYPFLFVGISFGVYFRSNELLAILLGFLASIFFVQRWLVYYELIKVKDCKGDKTLTTNINAENSLIKRISRKVIDPTNIDVILVIFVICAIFDKMFLILILYGIAFPLKWLIQAYFNLKYRV